MTEKNYIFSMKPYDVDKLAAQAAWMLEKRMELSSRKRLPGLWRVTDTLNAVPRTIEAEQKRRRKRNRWWGGLFLVMGIFLFVPGMIKPQELQGPLLVGLIAIIVGMIHLRKEDKRKNGFMKKAKKMLENMNSAMERQKLRLILKDTEFVLNGMGAEKKVSYTDVECVLETEDLFGLVYENSILILQKQEMLLGTAQEFGKQLEEKLEIIAKETV